MVRSYEEVRPRTPHGVNLTSLEVESALGTVTWSPTAPRRRQSQIWERQRGPMGVKWSRNEDARAKGQLSAWKFAVERIIGNWRCVSSI